MRQGPVHGQHPLLQPELWYLCTAGWCLHAAILRTPELRRTARTPAGTSAQGPAMALDRGIGPPAVGRGPGKPRPSPPVGEPRIGAGVDRLLWPHRGHVRFAIQVHPAQSGRRLSQPTCTACRCWFRSVGAARRPGRPPAAAASLCRASGTGQAVVPSVMRPKPASLVRRSASAALPPREPVTVGLLSGITVLP